MRFLRTAASVQYTDAQRGKPFFVDYLGFSISHEGDGLVVVVRDEVPFMLETNAEYAAQLSPLTRIHVDDIQALWAELASKPTHEDFTHPRFPNGPELREWGAWEFAVQDEGVCLVFQQWDTEATSD
ncbi:MAG: hypothetical protein AAGI54_11315 [Planctomycetota bacterium]